MDRGSEKKPRGLFVNTPAAVCSIHESGRMVYECLLLSRRYQLDYVELDRAHRHLSNQYDFYAFNYHHITMGWLDTTCVRRLSGFKMTFVLETLTNDPFVLCPSADFDGYGALDPTMASADSRVFAFPRPLELYTPPSNRVTTPNPTDIPVIGSFGFPSQGKGFELVVEAVNREFERAVVHINMPVSTYTDASHQRRYADSLKQLCRQVAKPGVEVQVTNDFMSKPDLIEWCAENTLNCFLYNRNQPGLSATTDQAIASGRPLAVSNNETFRHIHRYIAPYPYQSLRECIASSQPAVRAMQSDWCPANFAQRFEAMLDSAGLFSRPPRVAAPSAEIEMKALGKISARRLVSLRNRLGQSLLKRVPGLRDRAITPRHRPVRRNGHHADAPEALVLLVSGVGRERATRDLDDHITRVLQRSGRYTMQPVRCAGASDLKSEIDRRKPAAVVCCDSSLPIAIFEGCGVPVLGIVNQWGAQLAAAEPAGIDVLLCMTPLRPADRPEAVAVGRLLPAYINLKRRPEPVTIGVFATEGTNTLLQRLFDQLRGQLAGGRLVLYAGYCPASVTEGYRQLATSSGLKVGVRRIPRQPASLLENLAQNSLNAFIAGGQSDPYFMRLLDYAMAVQRPIAIASAAGFPHLAALLPAVGLETNSLEQILKNGIAPLVPYYNEWSEDRFVATCESVLHGVLTGVAAPAAEFGR